MKAALSFKEAKALDQEAQAFGISGTMLLEAAGLKLAQCIKKQVLVSDAIAIVYGKGNNGADALVAASHLLKWGYTCILYSPYNKDQLTDETARRFSFISAFKDKVYCFELGEQADFFEMCQKKKVKLIVDALFGIGLSAGRSFSKSILSLIAVINQQTSPVLAVDVPSGLCEGIIDQEQVIKASQSLTFAAQKQVLLDHPACCGDITLSDIGIPKEVYDTLGLFFPF